MEKSTLPNILKLSEKIEKELRKNGCSDEPVIYKRRLKTKESPTKKLKVKEFLSVLPDDCLQIILSFLEISNILRNQLVSKHFNSVLFFNQKS